MKLRITIDGQTYVAEVEFLESEEGDQPEASYEPVPALPLSPAGPETESGANLPDPVTREAVCRSPVTGIVVQINVEPGQKVAANDVLLVLESMKMETHLAAQYEAIIQSILVAPGAAVKAGQSLIEFEPAHSSPA